MSKLNVGVLGATGMVGQRFIQLLEAHPLFQISVLGASSRSSGKTYAQACNWKLDTQLPLAIGALIVQTCEPKNFAGCQVIFSGLDSDVATEIEGAFRAADFGVFSNAKNYRMDPLVPLVVPLVNADHLSIVASQRKSLSLKSGFIVTNPNCSTTGLVVALKPLNDAFGIKQLNVTTMQAVSGAGYPGISSLDIMGNVVPYIDGEEEKLETEALKILAKLDTATFVNADLVIDASCNRVPVIDGHTESVSLKFHRPPKSLEEVIQVLSSYKSEAQDMQVYSAPEQAIYLFLDQKDRPQPRLDLNRGKGMSVSVGRLRCGNYWDLEFSLLSHNTILGAAGCSIMNAEVALEMGLLK